MAKQLTTRIIFAGVDNVSSVLSGMQTRVAGFGRSFQNMGQGAVRAGQQASAAISLPAILAARGILKAQEDMERAQNELSRRSQITDFFQLEELKKQADQLADLTRFKAAEVTKLQTELFAAGLNKEIVLAITPQVTFGSIASDMDTRTFSDQITNMVNSFYGQITDPKRYSTAVNDISEQMALVSASSNTTFAEGMEAFKQFAPIARALKIPLEEVTGLIGSLANNGFKAAEAGRALRTGFLRSLMLTPKAMRLVRAEGLDFTKWLNIDDSKMDKDRFLAHMKSLIPDITEMNGYLDNYFSQSAGDVVGKMDQLQEDIVKRLGLKPTDAVKVGNRIAEFIGLGVESIDVEAMLKELEGVNPAITKEIFTMFQAGKFQSLLEDPTQFTNMMATVEARKDEILSRINPMTGKNYVSVVEFMAEQEMKGLPGALDILAATFDRFQRGLFTSFDYIDDFGRRMNTITDGIRNTLIPFVQYMDAAPPSIKKFVIVFGLIAAALGPILIYFGLVAMGLGALMRAASGALIPLTLAGRALSLIAVALTRFSGRGGAMAVSALTRMGAAGLVLAGAGLLIYKSWDKLKDVFSSIKDDIGYTSGMDSLSRAFKAFHLGHFAAGWALVNAAMNSFWITAKRVGGSIGGVLLDGLRAIFKEIDGVLPNFARFRAGIVAVWESLKRFGASIADIFGGFSAGDLIGTIKSLATALADGALAYGGAALKYVADALDQITAAIGRFRAVAPQGGIFAGLKAMWDDLPDTGKALTAFLGLKLLAKAIGPLALAMRAMRGLSIMSLVGGLTKLSALKLGAIGFGLAELGKSYGILNDNVDSGTVALAFAALPAAIQAAGMAASGAKALAGWAMAGAKAAAAYVGSFRIWSALAAVIGAAWTGLKAVAALTAGFLAGAAYSAGVKIASVIGAAISAVWSAVSSVAARTAGLLAGAAYTAAVKVAGAIGTLISAFWTGLSIGVATAAGTLMGTAYSRAAAVASAIGTAISAIWTALSATTAGAAGTLAGGAYSLAARAAMAIGAAISAAWGAISTAAAAIAGAAAGRAYAAGMAISGFIGTALAGAFTVAGAAGGASVIAAGAAGTALGLALGAAIAIAIPTAILAGLNFFDPKGNLGGLTKPIDDAIRSALNLPAKDTAVTTGELWDGLFGDGKGDKFLKGDAADPNFSVNEQFAIPLRTPKNPDMVWPQGTEKFLKGDAANENFSVKDQFGINLRTPKIEPANDDVPGWKRFLLGDAANEGFNFKQSMGIDAGIGGDPMANRESLYELKNSASAAGRSADANEGMQADMQALAAAVAGQTGILSSIDRGISAIPGAVRAGVPWAGGKSSAAAAPAANLPTTGYSSGPQ